MRQAMLVLVGVVAGMGMGCGPKPSLPTEDDSRKAFYARQDKVRAVEDALKKEIREARLTTAPPACTPPEDACTAVLRARDEAITAGQKRLQAVLTSLDAACAEVTVTSRARAAEILAARVATCPIGKRGDSIDPTKGLTAGDYLVGRGAYFKSDQVMHPGVSARREMQDGDTLSKIELYFFID